MKTKTYFISDLHLGAGYITDPRGHENAIAEWLRSIAPEARTLYLLGDVMDYWFEYRSVVPRGHVRFLGALAELADSGTEIVWLKGNHDIWLFDYLRDEIGLKVVDGVIDTMIDGRRFVMEHGDGVGEPRLGYRIMRGFFRNRFAQWLYAGIHPRWTVGFALAWSKHSRLRGRQMPDPGRLPANDVMIRFANDYVGRNGQVDYFVFGHRHVPVDMELDSGARLIVLGECFKKMSYGVWNGAFFELKRIKSQAYAPN
ncbi:MAG: UDP-2,3-diacylglucosamine diphosphatase [Paramuribaculum sp.]|nr:UDP-2,3-diacylglucosamine diphosphatase [Paramuribaculum sp.]MDE6324062.1 UDP-2,3-diacylglucosamine diphosphatase [Paramuribaculum sp.]